MEELLKLLANSNIKLVSRETGIPYARMHKWTKGGGKPKIDDYNTLKEYFDNKKVDKSKLIDKIHPEPSNSIEEQLSALKSEFADKERIYRELIAEKDKRLAEKDELIMVLKQQIAAKSTEPIVDTDTRAV